MSATMPLPDTTLRIVRVFDAARPRVFDAFVDPEALRVWFCPDGFAFEEITVDPSTGRGTLFTMVDGASGRRYTWTLDYTTVDRPRRIEWISTWRDGFAEAGRKTSATIEFRDVPGGTEVTLTHQGFIDRANRDDHAQGWSSGLTKLTRYLARPVSSGVETVSPGSAGV